MTCARPQLFARDGVGTSGWQSTWQSAIHGWLVDDARLATTRGAIRWVATGAGRIGGRRPERRRTPWPVGRTAGTCREDASEETRLHGLTVRSYDLGSCRSTGGGKS